MIGCPAGRGLWRYSWWARGGDSRVGGSWWSVKSAAGPSGPCGGQPGGSRVLEDLAEVVAGHEESPLAAGSALAAQQQFAAVLAGHDLAEGGFDDGFALGVGGASGFGAQLAGHALP